MADLPTEQGLHSHSSTRVSVAMCTYNGATFLPQLLASILKQTRQPDELVLCDDMSTDQTIPLMEAFSLVAPFSVRIFRNSRTLGPAQNFSRCIELCGGDVIILTDQDDVWFPERVADTTGAFEADAKLTFAYSECPLIDKDGRDLGRTIYSSLPITAADRRYLKQGRSLLPVLLRWGVLYGTTMAFRAELRCVFLPIPPLWSHDEWISLTLSAMGPSTRLQRAVTGYRQHAGQQVGTGHWTLDTHLGLAQKHDRHFYESEILRFEEAIAAIQAHPELCRQLLPALQQKLAFLRNRIMIQSGRFRMLLLFVQMLLQGDYRRFGAGLRSPLKDLLMLVGGIAHPQ